MRLRSIVCGISTVLLLGGTLAVQAPEASGWNFSNADVLNLLRAGRSDDAIMRTIMRARTAVIFKYETDDLVALKNAGASLVVLSAMLARSRQSLGSDFAPDVMTMFKGLKADTLTLVTRQGRQELGFSRGECGVEDYGICTHLDYPSARASIRTTDQRPSLLVRFESDPTTHFQIVKLYPIMKMNIRSFKSQGFRNGIGPDKGWRIAYTAAEEEKGVWRITPNADLQPGEYGLVNGVRLFGFGIDLQDR